MVSNSIKKFTVSRQALSYFFCSIKSSIDCCFGDNVFLGLQKAISGSINIKMRLKMYFGEEKLKVIWVLIFEWWLAGKIGFEPMLPESESRVLPLDDFPINFKY